MHTCEKVKVIPVTYIKRQLPPVKLTTTFKYIKVYTIITLSRISQISRFSKETVSRKTNENYLKIS